MITPISCNTNNINSNILSAIERPRAPRRMNAADSVSFTSKSRFKPSKIISSIESVFSKTFNTIENGIYNLINSKPVQAIKNGIVKGFKKTVSTIKSIPEAIGNLFKGIREKLSKKV